MARPLSCPVPFALLALLAGCSSSTQDDPQVSQSGDASASDGAITFVDGGTLLESDANPPTKTTEAGAGDDTGTEAGSEAGGAPVDAGTFDAAAGHILAEFPQSDGGGTLSWSRVVPVANAPQVPLAAKLDSQSPGSDQWASLARDGAWVAFVTQGRFDCQSGDCLAVAAGDGSNAALVEHTSGVEIVPVGRPAIAPGGNLIVFPTNADPNDGGVTPHAADLYAITRTSGAWGAPVLLTSGMTEKNAHDVSVSTDGTKVVFDCGPSLYQDPGTDICEAKTDGSGMSVLIAHTAGPGANDQNATHSPDFAPDGTIVFEADWDGTEKVWRFTAPTTFALVSPSDESDDNSPCVLPDGRIASLWLNRPGNTNSLHELKVMNADGSNTVMVVTGIDISDDGQSCGK